MGVKLEEAIAAINLLTEKLEQGKMDQIFPLSNRITTLQLPNQSDYPKQKEKKDSKTQKPTTTGVSRSSPVEGPTALFAKAHIVVAKVTSVEDHPTGSDKLWLLQIDIGNTEMRQVVAGLKKHVSKEELEDMLVIAILNLKPAKLGGELSEAMLLASACIQEDLDVVRLIIPPEGSEPGDLVSLSGHSFNEQSRVKTLKSDHWRGIAAALRAKGGKACLADVTLRTTKGEIEVARNMPDGAEIR